MKCIWNEIVVSFKRSLETVMCRRLQIVFSGLLSWFSVFFWFFCCATNSMTRIAQWVISNLVIIQWHVNVYMLMFQIQGVNRNHYKWFCCMKTNIFSSMRQLIVYPTCDVTLFPSKWGKLNCLKNEARKHRKLHMKRAYKNLIIYVTFQLLTLYYLSFLEPFSWQVKSSGVRPSKNI